MTFTVCATLNIAYLAFTRHVVCPRMCVQFLFLTTTVQSTCQLVFIILWILSVQWYCVLSLKLV